MNNSPVVIIGTGNLAEHLIKVFLNNKVELAGIIGRNKNRLEKLKNLYHLNILRNYDNILSACTYATSSVPKFQVEGQYCVDMRDQTWSKLYEMLAEVIGGTRSMPTKYEDIESELPTLEWPV